MEKKPIVSVTYKNKRMLIKYSLPYIKSVLRLSCVVHGPISGRLMGCTVNGFLSIHTYINRENHSQDSPLKGHKSAHGPHTHFM